MKFHVLIPARFDSARLPGKVLLDIAGKPMIQHVYEQCLQAGATQVCVATDDPRIVSSVEGFGGQTCMTSSAHQSGTDRLAEAVDSLSIPADDIVVNVQGDEPLIPPQLIQQVASNLQDHAPASVATLCEPLTDPTSIADPNLVKVVFDCEGYALYFSRAAIAWDRDHSPQAQYFRHIGIYAYRASFLPQFVRWEPCAIELTESLEQLRVLWHQHKIHVACAVVKSESGVDTLDDLEKIRAIKKPG